MLFRSHIFILTPHQALCSLFTTPHSPPSQVFADAQQLQPLQVYQAPLSLATVPHQALGRTQSSPAAPGGMKSPPDQPTKHLFTTGESRARTSCPHIVCRGPVHGIQPWAS